VALRIDNQQRPRRGFGTRNEQRRTSTYRACTPSAGPRSSTHRFGSSGRCLCCFAFQFFRDSKKMLTETPHAGGVSAPTTFREPSRGNAGPSGSPDSVIIRRMWEGGPLRQVANRKASPVYTAYGFRGSTCTFAGRYVCDGCKEPVIGVYRQKGTGKWVCAGCRR
jgi:hypothetical protein